MRPHAMEGVPVTIKSSKVALQLLRLIAAYTGEKQYAILERVLRIELARVQAQEKRDD